MKTFAVTLWLLNGLAWLSYASGNPTAASGIAGTGLMALFVTALACLEA